MAKQRKLKRSAIGGRRDRAPAPTKTLPSSIVLRALQNGGHKWTINFQGVTLTANTSSSSVSAISLISSKFAPALKRLADK
jgi:hypothetical protein